MTLDEALAAAEREASRPIAPARLGPWVDNMQARLADLQRSWKREAGGRYAFVRALVADCVRLAPRERATRLRRLRLNRELAALRRRTRRLRRRTATGPSPGWRDASAANALTRDVRGWVAEARSHVGASDAARRRRPRRRNEQSVRRSG